MKNQIINSLFDFNNENENGFFKKLIYKRSNQNIARFLKIILTPILFKIVIIPVLLLFMFTFSIISLEFFERRVKTMKKDAELISPGTS